MGDIMIGIQLTDDNHALVRAGIKTVTRRKMRLRGIPGSGWVIDYDKPQCRPYKPTGMSFIDRGDDLATIYHSEIIKRCPYGKPGDLIFIKEPVSLSYSNGLVTAWYCDKESRQFHRHQPGIETLLEKQKNSYVAMFMPSCVARTIIKLKSIRYEYLMDIDAVDAINEGIECNPLILMGANRYALQQCPAWRNYSSDSSGFRYGLTPEQSYRTLWESIHEESEATAWQSAVVWVLEFNVVSHDGLAGLAA